MVRFSSSSGPPYLHHARHTSVRTGPRRLLALCAPHGVAHRRQTRKEGALFHLSRRHVVRAGDLKSLAQCSGCTREHMYSHSPAGLVARLASSLAAHASFSSLSSCCTILGRAIRTKRQVMPAILNLSTAWCPCVTGFVCGLSDRSADRADGDD